MYTRFSTRKKVLATSTIILLIAIASSINYFLFLTRPEYIDEPIPYILLLLIEIYVVLQSLGAWWTILYSNTDPRNEFYYQERDRLKNSWNYPKSIDIFVTTYGEALDVISETVTGARDMAIAHNTYILDDGHSSEVAKLAAQLGVGYIAREGNAGKKAGNINNALSMTTGELVAIFDADHRPAKNFLVETLPFFADESIAFVQTPQVLRNRNSIISAGSADSQRIFYDIMMFGRNHFNSAFWVGTNAIFRRKALEDVGGVFIHSSEDILTSYRLHQRGWHSIYIPETLAIGYAPDSVASYFAQQLRWAYGSLYIFFKENPIFTNLNFDQKIQYLLGSTFYFNGIVLLLIVSLPVVFMLTGAKPIDAPMQNWVSSYIPYFIMQFAIIMLLLGKLSWQAIVLSLASFPAYLRAFILLVRGRNPEWKATGSGAHSGLLTYLTPHFVVIYACIISIGIGLINIREAGTTVLSTLWLGFNAFIYLVFVYSVIRNHRKPSQHISVQEYLTENKFKNLNYQI